jgi:hypothetical protein
MKADKIVDLVEGVTKKWAKQRRAEERSASAVRNRGHSLTYAPADTLKDAAWDAMEEAYMKASAGGTLPALARQIMYAARAYIQNRIGKPLNSQYFIQTLLPDYMEWHDCSDWNVVFDARGHFHEPQTSFEVPLGTLEVRNYLGRVDQHAVDPSDFSVRESFYPTVGPKHRYGAILFIEKEGFMPLLEAVHLRERYDIAIMSTKGMSNTASRELVDKLCGQASIPLLVMHDFDKSGFSIVGTLKRATRRYSFRNKIEVIDIGLRMDDTEGLQDEEVFYKSSEFSIRSNLMDNGATRQEADFISKRRVELNAMASDELVAWIEGKLDAHGISKLVPDDVTLGTAYQRAAEQAAIQKLIDETVAKFRLAGHSFTVPEDLGAQIEAKLAEQPARSWDSVLRDIVESEAE